MPQHLVDLEVVLKLIQANYLVAKKSKCSFAGPKVEYLRHIITKNGVSTDPSKIEAMVQWPQPTTVKQLRGFLGLAGSY